VSAFSPGVLVGGRAILCDCHSGPMYYFPVSLAPEGDLVMCWVSDCGRCYNKSSGYFNLCLTRRTVGRIDEDTRSTVLCSNGSCAKGSSMVVTRSDGTSIGEDKTCWYCFDCGTEFPRRTVRSLWEQLLQSLRLFSYREFSAKHSPVAIRDHSRGAREIGTRISY
jgi:hypothetical protein